MKPEEDEIDAYESDVEEDVEDQAWDGEDVEDVATGRQAPASGRQAPASGRQAPIRPHQVPRPLRPHGPGNVATGYQHQHPRPRQVSMKCQKKRKRSQVFYQL